MYPVVPVPRLFGEYLRTIQLVVRGWGRDLLVVSLPAPPGRFCKTGGDVTDATIKRRNTARLLAVYAVRSRSVRLRLTTANAIKTRRDVLANHT